MKTRILVFTLILLSFVSTACTQDDGWQAYQNDALGVSFELPDAWVMRESDGVLNIAIDQEALDNEISTGAGASITLATPEDFDGWSDPQDILDLFMDYFEYGRDDLKMIGEPKFVTVQELPAWTVTYHGTVREQTGFYTATVITNEDRIALVLTFDGSEGGQHQETLSLITNSVLVYPPSE